MFQFVTSVTLLIVTAEVYNQVSFIMKKEIGLERDNLLRIRMEEDTVGQFSTLKEGLLSDPQIISVTRADQNPLSVGSSTTNPDWAGKDANSMVVFNIIKADGDFVQTMGMDLKEGSGFRGFPQSTRYLINEEMARLMGFDEAVGRQLRFWGNKGQIVGVVGDFHYESMHRAIEPLIVINGPGNEDAMRNLFIRIGSDIDTALTSIGEAMHRINPDHPLHFRFVDKDFENIYRSETRLGRLYTLFSVLSILISCFGLFGLGSFVAEQRRKELGIRKCLGATVFGLMLLVSGSFLRLVVIGFCISVPIAHYVARDWLNSFHYRVDFGWSVVFLSGLAACLVAWLTISVHVIRVARGNPTDSLKQE